ncbi:dehydrase and lipid transport-domain-containing protein [Dichomitus squalens]|uniref:Dehydrase and lipid transport-domain-containing protein n=1 Tax=Dichomitus squalens TaxID=114155 RepID=A0A4Q9N2P9_9APHY|nr:dehydrase and lipid transport-domain-containing protein [Dichomitus squalens]
MALLPRLVHGATPFLTRRIFKLPDLSSLAPLAGHDGNGSRPQVYHERKIFPYTQKQLYELVADASSYPRFLPFCTSARVLNKEPHPSDPHGRLSMDVELTVGFMSFTESYVSKVTCRPYESVEAVAASSTPLFKSLDTIWRFQPASAQSPHLGAGLPSPAEHLKSTTAAPQPASAGDASPTLVTLDLSFAFVNPVHAAVSATFFGQVSKMMVKAFEERSLEIYGEGKA